MITSVDIKDILVAASIGGWPSTAVGGWLISIDHLPEDQDQIVVIVDTPGSAANPKHLLDEPTWQIQVRAAQNGYLAAATKALAVKDALLGFPPQNLNDGRYVGIYNVVDTFSLGQDENGRPRLVSNWRAFYEPDAGTYRVSL